MKVRHHPIKFVLWGTGSALGQRASVASGKIPDPVTPGGGFSPVSGRRQVIRPGQVAAEKTGTPATYRNGRRWAGE